MAAVLPATEVRPPSLTLQHGQISEWPRRLCWFVLALLHLTAGAFFALLVVVYTQVSDKAFGSNSFVYDLILPIKYLPKLGIACGVLGSLHVLSIISMLQASVSRRCLAFRVEINRRPGRSSTMSQHAKASFRAMRTRLRTIPFLISTIRARDRLTRPFRLVFLQLAGRRGWIGVDGPYFEQFFCVREVLQVFLQTVQLYKMARLLSTQWLLHFYVLLLFLNCWSSQLIRFIERRSSHGQVLRRRRRRLYTLLLDTFLDNVVSFFMPLVVAFPYALLYVPSFSAFPPLTWANDIWIMGVTSDIRLVFPTSWVDAMSKITFALLVLLSANAVLDLCHDEFDSTQRAETKVMVIKPGPKAKLHKHTGHKLLRWIHSLLIVWGIVLVSVHVYATSRPWEPGCLLPVRPWFSSQSSCGVFLFDCHERSSHGESLNPQDALMGISPSTVVYLIYRHCRQLHVPAAIQSFHDLLGLKIYNVSIAMWTLDAAVQQNKHNSFRLLTMVRVVFPNDGDGFPDGLLHKNFPPTVRDVNICVSNLRSLPSNLDSMWPRGLSLLLEHSRFTEIPEVLTRMDAGVISLNGNQITKVPVQKLLLPDRQLKILAVGGGNPVVDAGQNVTKISLPLMFYWLILDSTNISTIPLWMADPTVITRMWVIFSDTPLCQEVKSFHQNPPTAPGFYWQQFIDCYDYSKVERSLFRLSAEDATSTLDPTRIGDPRLVLS